MLHARFLHFILTVKFKIKKYRLPFPTLVLSVSGITHSEWGLGRKRGLSRSRATRTWTTEFKFWVLIRKFRIGIPVRISGSLSDYVYFFVRSALIWVTFECVDSDSLLQSSTFFLYWMIFWFTIMWFECLCYLHLG